ncbi:norsolorinic acid reductase/dehydrogenase [Neohortaea acidophila]|uniref:Norsolorinic acid reductase/dehydrogenase n=1 Tax=Neohortaea acidophila TaxID=245834 RepID=A0A6A6PFV2_9PEZI|nr:norsolorinic acid reductase/dehydrogenase [Neohortaea acidophila]KAF2478859.1 norsolorinic acid reductase/dehydrogenase [Neohortaea acidophila]
MSIFKTVDKPPSLLGYHRLLSPTAGVRVSPLCLGAMNFGTNWESFTGECSKETAFAILDYFYEQGGNFIDTANNYQGEQSEQWLGEWIKARGNRDELVLATKFTTGYRTIGAHEKIKSNFSGNHAKSLKLSVEASLKKLGTDYIDLLWLHWWDFSTSIPELMNSLHHLVAAGKVLYLGISDTPAWVVVKCNDYARFHGLTQFCVYQGKWSAAERDFERDILPMVHEEGMGLCPWGALGQGKLKSREAFKNRTEGRAVGSEQPEHFARIAGVMEDIAKTKGKDIPVTSIALAYVMHKAPYVFPIVGGRKIEHLKGNIEALSISLSDDEIDKIDAAEPFDLGFPMNFLFEFTGGKYKTSATAEDVGLTTVNTALESVPKPKPITPGQGQRKIHSS